MVSLSRTKQGSHLVQEALERAPTDDARASLAAELRGHVTLVAKCVNANHVLQKCITTGNPQSLQFVVDELCAAGPGLTKIAKNRYGCRIFQRLLEHCSPAQLQQLVDTVIANALTLTRHLYGTYVVQGVIEYGTKDQKRRLVALLIEHVDLMGADIHGNAALSVALSHAEEPDRLRIARSLLRQPGMLASMSRSRRGYLAVILALEALDGHCECRVAIGQLMAEIHSLRSCRYGKFVAAHLTEMMDMVGHA